MIRRALRTASALLFATALAATACSRDIPLGSDVTSGGAPSGTSGRGGSGGTAGTAGNATTGGTGGSVLIGGSGGSPTAEGGAAGAPEHECVPATCHGKTYLCGDCMDNDGDGKIDADDPECTGPCDNREDSFDVGLPGSSADKCSQDCLFDNGNGAGNDGCRFSHQCDPLSVAPDYPPTGSSACAYDENATVPGGTGSCAELRAEQAASCTTVCGPLTPNGCDCFGCCELPSGSFHFVGLGPGASTCTIDNLDDPQACPPCTPVDSCMNHCDPCESCVGRLEPLASCTGSPACPDALKQCDFGGSKLCPQGFYCITGCCVAEPR
jgi:hypothetical protein